MVEATPTIYARSPQTGPILQGELLSNVTQPHYEIESIGTPEPRFRLKVHPLVLVLSQDCDLELDFRAREKKEEPKYMPNVLLCEVEQAEILRRGNPGMNSTIWDRIWRNKDERYHFLEQVPVEADATGKGLAHLGLDFKRHFTIPTDELYRRIGLQDPVEKVERRCSLVSPYLEHLSARFAYFMHRVALPRDHSSD